jgi:hypothetical protein
LFAASLLLLIKILVKNEFGSSEQKTQLGVA